MKSLFGVSAILLTASLFSGFGANARAEDSDLSTCAMPAETAPNLDWLSDLSKSLDASVADSPKPKPEANAPVSRKPSNPVKPTRGAETADMSDRETEPVDLPIHRYDLSNDPPERWLAKLTSAAHWSARVCRKGICNPTKTKYRCYRGVKDALVRAGMVDQWWAEEAAVNAHRRGTLLRKGFKNVISEGFDAKNAPLGSVLVYAGGRYRCRDAKHRAMQCGHIEIKVNQNQYCSDFCTHRPVSHRTLVGVYVKE